MCSDESYWSLAAFMDFNKGSRLSVGACFFLFLFVRVVKSEFFAFFALLVIVLSSFLNFFYFILFLAFSSKLLNLRFLARDRVET